MSDRTSRLKVEFGVRSYDIIVQPGLIAQAYAHIAPVLESPRVVIVTDDHVGALYAKPLTHALLPHGIRVEEIRVASGEGSKSFSAYESLVERLLALTIDRKTTVIALGGGVIGDLAGFAASTVLRGIPFIQIPTTLLAQVDSSVGGKTAINTKTGKNLVGSFYQPTLVLADTDTLKTLPGREMRSGYAEIIKYGLIMNPEFYRWCLANGAQVIAGDASALQQAVMRSCAMKAKIVAADEHEDDQRALLNFGHTFAHALEAEAGYSEKLTHGEAVAIGMVMACRLSSEMGLIDAKLEPELVAHLRAVGLPTELRDVKHAWDAKRIASHFASDKKAQGGTLTFIVLDRAGSARVARDVDPALAQRVVQSYMG